MHLWFGAANTSGRSLMKIRFLNCMESHWNEWASEKLSAAEVQSWKAIVEKVYTTNIKEITDLGCPETWAEVTVHKVLFRGEFFQSRYAALAQIKFPDANLNEWEPNKNGPTDHPSFEKNRYIRQVILGRKFEEAKELAKRPWSFETEEYRSKRLCSEAPSSITEAAVEPGSVTCGATPLISNPEDVVKVFGDLESQLILVRKAAEENTKIHQQAIDALKVEHQEDLKKHRKYTHDTIASIHETYRKRIEAFEKAHEEKLSTLRAKYEGAISTSDKALQEGMTALQGARQEISKLNKDKN